MPNRLAASTSAYLRQHAGNPVDWYSWSAEAFAAAKATDRPILLSVGYSACHWCHVMAHESFEDPAVAALMNDRFVNVKVDREERPDVDALYMDAVQALTGQGGWPMTVFLTPDGEPFFGGTYFPPVPRGGLASFTQILDAVAVAWRERRGDVRRSATELTSLLRGASAPPPDPVALSADLVNQAAGRLVAASDRVHGGLAGRMKFPSAPTWQFLLGHAARGGAAEPMAVVVEALDAMAAGGLYDHLGGGFHRYCVDAGWTVPHFEKMLYDNAQLLRLYVAGWQVIGTARYRQVAEETADYLLREMTGPHGAFYASQDADGPGGEGASYVWTPDEVRAVLPAPLADLALAWYGVHGAGNFDGGTVLSARRTVSAVSAELGLDPAVVTARLATVRGELLAARGRRPPPATDRAVIVAWNGLTIDALARAGVALGRPEWLATAVRAAQFVGDQVTVAGGLAHSWADGVATVPAFLDDVAAMAGAYLTLYETTFDPAWLASAHGLADALRAGFADAGGGFYRTTGHHDALVARQMDLLDASVPSGNALAAQLFLRLAAITGLAEHEDVAEGALRRARRYLVQAPGAMGAALMALDDHLAGMRTATVMGPRDRADTRALLAVLQGAYWPGLVMAGADGPDGPWATQVPVLTGRGLVDGRATAYVCRRGVCGLPATSPMELAAQLREPPGA